MEASTRLAGILAVVWLAVCAAFVAAQTDSPRLAPNIREPLSIKYVNSSLTDILRQVGQVAGIQIRFASDIDSSIKVTVSLDKVSIEQALDELVKLANLTYKVLDAKTVVVQRSDQKL